MLEEDNSSAISASLPEPLTPTITDSNASTRSTSSPTQSHAIGTKSEQNSAILQASIDVSIRSQNQPLALLLKSAIAGINEVLKPEFGDNAIQAASSQDNTPAGTAERIVSLSTGFFDAFKQQHPGENVDDVLTNFMATIRSGFEKGAKEAQGILKGLDVLNNDIASNIDKTLALVEEGYTRFETAQRDSLITANRAPGAD